MPDKVKIPGLGQAPKKTVYLGAGVIVVLGAIYVYRQNKAKSAAAASVTAAGTNNIDPATGFAYGSPEDAAALATQASYVAGGNPGGISGGSGLPATPGVFTNNADWERAAVDFLSNTVGLPSGAVSAALGKYIAGEAVSDANEHSYILQAIAAEGKPPVPGINGYPPSIRSVAPGPTPAGLKAPVLGSFSHTATTDMMKWTSVSGADHYHVQKDGNGLSDVRGTQLQVARPGHYRVAAFDKAGNAGPYSNTITV